MGEISHVLTKTMMVHPLDQLRWADILVDDKRLKTNNNVNLPLKTVMINALLIHQYPAAEVTVHFDRST